MKIVVAGGTGFIGVPLVRELEKLGETVVLTRDPAKVRVGRGVAWDASPGGSWAGEVAGADAVINLAGENIGEGRWTDEKKQRILNSRIDATRALVDAIERHPRERVFISGSAIGIYGDRGDEILDESSEPGEGFLAEVCKAWEEAASGARSSRTVIPRFGVVLAADGGALPKMALPFRLFAGGRVGNGRQWVSWVALEDLIRLLVEAVENSAMKGVYNVTAPEPVRNDELAKALGAALRRPAVMPAPAFALRLALGEMADALLLASHRVLPRRASNEGFRFSSTEILPTLRRIYS
jgi:uncharacterized protein